MVAWCVLNPRLSLTKIFSFHLCSITGLVVLFLWPLCFLKSEHNRLKKINIYFGFAFVSYRTQSCCLKSFRAATPTVVPRVFYLKVLLTLLLTLYILYFWSHVFVITGFLCCCLTSRRFCVEKFIFLPPCLCSLFFFCCETRYAGQSFREAHLRCISKNRSVVLLQSARGQTWASWVSSRWSPVMETSLTWPLQHEAFLCCLLCTVHLCSSDLSLLID